MSKHRWVLIRYPGGRKVRVIVEEQEYYQEFMRLQRLYGIRYRIGPRCNKDVATALKAVGRQRRIVGRKIVASRPLSPDFGRGSGGPI